MRGNGIAALVALFAGVSAVTAGPAYAELVSGTYALTGEGIRPGFTLVFASCGPDCMSVASGGQLHRQGNVWSGTVGAGDGCATSIDENSLAGTYHCPMFPPVAVQLTKAG